MALISENTHNADNTSLNTMTERGGVKGGKRVGKRMQVLQNVKLNPDKYIRIEFIIMQEGKEGKSVR